MMIYCTGSIKILDIPDGDKVPEWVRKVWVGLTLPVVGVFACDGTHTGIEDCPVYVVKQTAAFLRLESRRASQWWCENKFPHGVEDCFGFKVKQARIVEPLMLIGRQQAPVDPGFTLYHTF
ncbi:MAG: hypothetical protein PHG25_00355 [Candidatus Pacebacteria bacterium]|nr:hypothetical protein [Candidatus Paceibacterota bacterium]